MLTLITLEAEGKPYVTSLKSTDASFSRRLEERFATHPHRWVAGKIMLLWSKSERLFHFLKNENRNKKNNIMVGDWAIIW